MMLLVDLIFFSSCPLYKIKNKYLQFHASPATKNLCLKMKNGMKTFVSNQSALNCKDFKQGRRKVWKSGGGHIVLGG